MMDHIMAGSIDPDILNREAGFGVASSFRYRHNDPDGLNAGLHHLLLLCWRLQQTCTTRQNSVSLHPSISKAISLLGEDSWSGSLGRLARECGLSEAHFSRMFARQVGVPLSRYRNSLRLARFWEHFRRPAKPTILEAVYAAGFGSYAQFYKVFADAYGAGPRACLQNRMETATELAPSPSARAE
jgi:AraC-like DNA-binding protein